MYAMPGKYSIVQRTEPSGAVPGIQPNRETLPAEGAPDLMAVVSVGLPAHFLQRDGRAFDLHVAAAHQSPDLAYFMRVLQS